MSIVRAVDVGFCNTKFTMVGASGPQGLIGCDLFPSLTPIAAADSLGLTEMMRKKKTIIVEVNGKRFEVGYDVESAIASNYGRTMAPSFCMTDSYMALVNASLYYMGVDKIDMLVLGLPVSAHSKYKEDLAKKMIGVHQVVEKEVMVEHCRVLAQPVGGFFEFGSKEGNMRKFERETNLILDVGFFTTDWFVCSGMTPVSQRCGAANNGGMGSVISAICAEISNRVGEALEHNVFGRVDTALRSVDKKVKIFGKEFDLNEFIPVGKAAALEAVNKMVNKVGTGSDIDNIVLVGGGGWFFEDVVKKQFPRHEISLAGESNFSNVRGFQMYGYEALKKIKASAA